MILALIPTTSATESFLDNFDEAGFDLHSASVILQDQALRNKIADDTGPLKGATLQDLPAQLARLGVARKDIRRYLAALKHGNALVALDVPQENAKAAQEMLQDINASTINILHSDSGILKPIHNVIHQAASNPDHPAQPELPAQPAPTAQPDTQEHTHTQEDTLIQPGEKP